MAKASVEVRLTGADKRRRVWIGGSNVKLDDEGKGEKKVKKGAYYAIQYAVEGAEGTPFSIAITKPPGVKSLHSAVFDKSETDMGGWWFNVAE